MQLRQLRIEKFRNLREVQIDFPADLLPRPHEPAAPRRVRSHALIGQNGTGKSNLIEALITIFRDIDLDREASFDYTLEYVNRGRVVKVKAELGQQRRPFVWIDSKPESQGALLRQRELLPSHVFAYYSGRNERIEALFVDHQRRFNRRQEITAEEVLPEQLLENFTASDSDIRAIEEARRRRDASLRHLGDDRLRRLFYCRGGHTQLVLLACLLSPDPVFQKVLANLNIEALESALFVLKEPHRIREKRRNGSFDENDLSEGDPRFWYARGNVVNEFLDKLWRVAWAPIEHEAPKQIDFRGRTERQRQLYLFVPSHQKLEELRDLVGSVDSFFRYAEGAYIGDLIEEVRITVKKRDEHGGRVSFTQLSEGELQMLTVLGLMRITRESNCLFLLDEPDTHLNPIWKLGFFEEIEKVLSPDPIKEEEEEEDEETEETDSEEVDDEELSQSQVLVTTHDPLMIGGLRKEQVHVLRREGNRTIALTPDVDPQGMGVTGLLKSELFGLSSTLDLRTEQKLLERNELLARKFFAERGEEPPFSEEESARLKRLSDELADLGFATSDFRDRDYALFVRKMSEHRSLRRPQLSLDELAAQEEIAARVVEEILSEEQARG